MGFFLIILYCLPFVRLNKRKYDITLNLTGTHINVAQDLFIITILRILFEFNKIHSEMVWNKFYMNTLKMGSYDKIGLKTKGLFYYILEEEIINKKGAIKCDELAKIQFIFQKLGNYWLNDRIICKIQDLYTKICMESKNFVKYKSELIKEMFFSFALMIKNNIRMTTKSYIFHLKYLILIKNSEGAKYRITNNMMPISGEMTGIDFYENEEKNTLDINLNLFERHFIYFTTILGKYSKKMKNKLDILVLQEMKEASEIDHTNIVNFYIKKEDRSDLIETILYNLSENYIIGIECLEYNTICDVFDLWWRYSFNEDQHDYYDPIRKIYKENICFYWNNIIEYIEIKLVSMCGKSFGITDQKKVNQIRIYKI